MDQAQSYKTVRIKAIRKELKEFKVFELETEGEIFYKSGQYLTLIHKSEPDEIRRSYSITSSPGLNEPLAIGIKRIPNGFFSRLLVDHAEVGDELVTIGAGGLFVLPGNIDQVEQIFFFAAGSGITPIYSLIKTCLHFHSLTRVVLIYSSPSESSTIFIKEIRQLQEKFTSKFQVEWLFSNSQNLSGARLYRDHLISLVKKYALGSYRQALYYTCGPLAYMRMCTYVLQEMDVSSENIKKENFLIAQPPPIQLLPPDQATHSAIIHFNNNKHIIVVEYPDTVLKAAKKRGIMLPYSCETGRCASCLAHCIKGIVWLSHNEVLTEKELGQGMTLTCVGHPIGGDVELVIG
jgi:ferredoxin-NADP reductase